MRREDGGLYLSARRLGDFDQAFAAGRVENGFAAAFAGFPAKRLTLLAFILAGGLAGLALAVVFGYMATKQRATAFAMITLGMAELVFAMSLMFPTIYGIALEGLGEDSKFAAAYLVMAIVGGAIMPTLQGMILDIGGTGYTDVKILGVPEVNFSFVLPLICFFLVWLFAARVRKVGS